MHEYRDKSGMDYACAGILPFVSHTYLRAVEHFIKAYFIYSLNINNSIIFFSNYRIKV
jgi:hypothetical protein